MAQLDLKPTRIELIRTNRRIKLAKRGLDLLKMKRSSLVMEFCRISRSRYEVPAKTKSILYCPVFVEKYGKWKKE